MAIMIGLGILELGEDTCHRHRGSNAISKRNLIFALLSLLKIWKYAYALNMLSLNMCILLTFELLGQ
jgi:hypothetical protein